MKRVISILVLAMVMFWYGSAMAANPGDRYQLIPDDFGYYFNQPCGTGEDDTLDNWCFQPNFLPIARLWQETDGTYNMNTGYLLKEINFAVDWAANAVSPHRQAQKAAFTKYEDPELGTMVPDCYWEYDMDSTFPQEWKLNCTETRPAGYEGSSLLCENEPYQAVWTDLNGTIIRSEEIPYSVCAEAGIVHIPANSGGGQPPPRVVDYRPSLGCEAWPEPFCVGQYSLSDMGEFNVGGEFIWIRQFVDLVSEWYYSNPDTFPDYWTPVKISGLIGNDYRLERRVYPDGHPIGMFSLLDMNLQTGEAVSYPSVFLTTDPNTGESAAVWQAPAVWPDGQICEDGSLQNEHCDGTLNASDGDWWNDISPDNTDVCCRPFMDSMKYSQSDVEGAESLTKERVDQVKWLETGEIAEWQGYDGGIYWYISYNNSARMWSEADIENTYGPTIRYWFPTLASLGPQNIEITYDGTKTDILTIDVTDVRDMPAVPAVYTKTVGVNKTTKSGKVINNEREITIQNILIREVVNPQKPEEGTGLVIQWPEPEAALFGGMELRLYIAYGGSSYILNEPETNKFLFVDAPAQAGAVVIPANTWQIFKAEALSNGETEIMLMLMYRVKSDNFMNRGHSDMVMFPIQ